MNITLFLFTHVKCHTVRSDQDPLLAQIRNTYSESDQAQEFRIPIHKKLKVDANNKNIFEEVHLHRGNNRYD
jgi:hypothetical protein